MKKIFYLISAVILFTACKNETVKNKTVNTKTKSLNLVNATTWFQLSAEMEAAYIQTFNTAKSHLLIALDSLKSEKAEAVVVDIDETMLDNSPFEAYLIKNNLDFSKDLWNKWVSKAEAKPVPGALDFTRFAKQHNVEVFYISNRSVKNLQPTLLNLQKDSFPYADTTHILLKDTTSNKTYRRNKVAETHNIILYIGDNLRDFNEIFKDRSENFGKNKVKEYKNYFGTKYFMLSNPMYGEWEKPFSHSKNKIQTIIDSLNSF